jgi:hypothetical protein
VVAQLNGEAHFKNGVPTGIVNLVEWKDRGRHGTIGELDIALSTRTARETSCAALDLSAWKPAKWELGWDAARAKSAITDRNDKATALEPGRRAQLLKAFSAAIEAGSAASAVAAANTLLTEGLPSSQKTIALVIQKLTDDKMAERLVRTFFIVRKADAGTAGILFTIFEARKAWSLRDAALLAATSLASMSANHGVMKRSGRLLQKYAQAALAAPASPLAAMILAASGNLGPANARDALEILARHPQAVIAKRARKLLTP